MIRIPSPTSLRASLMAALVPILALAAHAQDPTEVSGFDKIGVPKTPAPAVLGYVPDVPRPPRELSGRMPRHERLPIPAGPFRPGPGTPPSIDIDPAQQAPDTGQFVYFQNEPVTPPGAGRSVVGEPSVALVRDTVFQTGNTYAARSLDNGQTWEHVSPYTFFPTLDGGAAGDQRVYYVESHDITVWILQYYYSATTQNGSQRIAIANGRQDLRDPSPSAWTSYVFKPQDFGYGVGNWLDFPDCAASAGKFHVSANVFDANNLFQGAVRWMMDLQDMKDNLSKPFLTWSYDTSAAMLGSTYRFAEGGTLSDRVFYAAIKNTSEIYVYYVYDSGAWNRVTRSVATFSTAIASCPGPDGRDWCGDVTGRFRGSFGNASEVGFILTSAAQAGRPLPYTRVTRFTADGPRTVIAEHDIWGAGQTWAYGTGRSNANGDIGLVIAVGGPNDYVRSTATIIDQYQPWGGGSLTWYRMGTGTHGPYLNRWGDYFDVHKHPLRPNTFYATGMHQNGGPNSSDSEPRFVWFGRDDYEPIWPILTVSSAPITGVAITQDVEDLDGLKDGTTNYTRRFAPRQAYELEAPIAYTVGGVGGTGYAFLRWAVRSSPTGSFATRPIGENVLTVNNIEADDDLAEARYVLRHDLAVLSTNPSSGIVIDVSPPDIFNMAKGNTGFVRYYRDGEPVTLTAPGTSGPNTFRRWTINGVPQPESQLAVTGSLTQNLTAVAEYGQYVPGRVQQIGAGCKGSSGSVPGHTITWPMSLPGPQLGTPTDYELSLAPPNTPVALAFGLSTAAWGAIRLPLDLGIIGMNGCFLRHDIVVSPGLRTNASGAARLSVPWPEVPAAVGTSIFSTFTVVDPGANALGLVLSDAMETLLGGWR